MTSPKKKKNLGNIKVTIQRNVCTYIELAEKFRDKVGNPSEN